MRNDAAYDVFLSYSSADRDVAARIAHRLLSSGVRAFLDVWDVPRGQPWQPSVERALADSASCVILIGHGGLGPVQSEESELAHALARQGALRAVIPVLLPGARLPSREFLSRWSWVDLSKDIEDEYQFHVLVTAIRGIAPGPPYESRAEAGAGPYRGLEPFDEEHAPFFFGRESLVQRMLHVLRQHRFACVLGSSGSGKSSVVKAGLLPALRAGAIAGSSDWMILTMRPGERPLETLAVKLARFQDRSNALDTFDRLIERLRTRDDTLHLASMLLCEGDRAAPRIVIVVDQLEELFTQCRDDGDRRSFVANLLHASRVSGGRVVLVATLRADFYAQCMSLPELAIRLEGHSLSVLPMDPQDLCRAIEEPASKLGVRAEDGLTDLILKEVVDRPGTLPLLQHALLELWKRRKNSRLTVAAYREIGGVEKAVAMRAEAVFEASPPEIQTLIRWVMMRLVLPGSDTEDARRRIFEKELHLPGDPAAAPGNGLSGVLACLTQERLVLKGNDPVTNDTTVELVHEALIKHWPRLRAWLDEDRSALLVQRRLTESAAEWLRVDRDRGALLRGIRLQEAQAWAERHNEDLNELELQFLQTSLDDAQFSNAVNMDRVLHELSSPIVGIRADAEYALSRLRSERVQDTDLLRRKLENIMLNSADMSRLLLMLSVNKQGDFVRDRRPTRLIEDILVRTIGQIPQWLREKSLAIHRVEIDPSARLLPRLMLDWGAMQLVFYNLLRNAAKYSRESAADFRIHVQGDSWPETLVLRIRDWGIGIPPGAEERIFQAGYRADNARRADVRGLGLGLFVVRQVMQGHGGDCRVTNLRDPTELSLMFPRLLMCEKAQP